MKPTFSKGKIIHRTKKSAQFVADKCKQENMRYRIVPVKGGYRVDKDWSIRNDPYKNINHISGGEYSKNKKVRVRLYNKWTTYPNMSAAKKDMLDNMSMSEGAERERYTKVYLQLNQGLTEASDE